MDEEVLYRVQVDVSCFDENSRTFLEVPLEILRDSDYIGLRIYANDGTILKIGRVYLQKDWVQLYDTQRVTTRIW